jgi:transcriptional regulator with GAF, ATPase, and Fis domain
VHIDSSTLRESLDRLQLAPYEPDLVRALERIISAVNTLFDYDGAGMMFVDDNDDLHYVAATGEIGRNLEEAQLAAGEGPCIDAFVHDRLITSKDVHNDSRWPMLSGHLDERIKAVAGAPVRMGGSPVGTLNVYRSQAQAWDDSDTDALRAYTVLSEEILTTALAARDQSVLAGQLQYALDYRIVIERATGYLMAAHGLDAVTAFQMLRRQARDSRRRVADVAAQLLDDPTSPPPPPKGNHR